MRAKILGHRSYGAAALAVPLILALTLPAYAEPTDYDMTAAVVASETVPPTTPPPTTPPPTTPPPAGGGTTTPPKTDTGTPAKKPSRTAPQDESVLPVPADPKTKEFRDALAARQARLDEFMAQLDELDREFALSAEAYNEALDRLRATQDRLKVSEEDLAKARQAYEIQNDLLEARARTIYRGGGSSLAAFEVLLESKSVGDFFARLRFLNQIGVKDAQVAEMLAAQKAQIEGYTTSLKDAEVQAQALEFDLKARKIEILLRISERQQLLASAQADLLSLLDSEAARRQIEEQALLKAILAGAEGLGVQVIPGTPIETALAYHGIPYLWGGETPSGFDCSGLILYVFRQHGVNLPHYSGSQFALGMPVVPANLQPNDVVFFGNPIHHVGLYIGGGYYLHAPRTGDFVKVSRLADRNDYAGARRYAWQPRLSPIMGVTQPPLATTGALSLP